MDAEQIAKSVAGALGWTPLGLYPPPGPERNEMHRYASERLAAAIAPLIRDAQAEAWDEGRDAEVQYAVALEMRGPFCAPPVEPLNPYRTTTEGNAS